jgi:hypothetical protein
MRHPSTLIPAAAALLWLGATGLAAAQTSTPTNAARADALFNEGVKLFEAGRTHEACARFGESMKLDPANGTLQNLALCHEKEGKAATAWREFTTLVERASAAKQAEREALARQHLGALAATLSKLALTLGPDANVAEVRIDGVPLARGDWATPQAIDPGDHVVTLSAPGKKTIEQHVAVTPGPSTQTIVVPRLEDAVTPPAPSVEKASRAPAPETASAGGGLGGQQVLALTVGAVGVAGLVAGSVFGLVASSRWSQAQKDCNPSCTPDSPALGERDDANSAATASTIAFIAGGAAVAAGAVLFFTAPRSVTVAPAVGAGAGGVLVQGFF